MLKVEDLLSELDYAAEADMALTFDGPSSTRAAEAIRAEIERLNEECVASMSEIAIGRAEVERLKMQAEAEQSRAVYLSHRAGEAEAEVEQLKTEREQLKVLLRTCRGLLPQHYTQHIDEIDDATGVARP